VPKIKIKFGTRPLIGQNNNFYFLNRQKTGSNNSQQKMTTPKIITRLRIVEGEKNFVGGGRWQKVTF